MAAALAGITGLIAGVALAWLVGVRRAQARQRRALREKLSLLSGAAQQMRAPLNEVLGLVQTLAFHMDQFPAEMKERVNAISGAGASVKAVMLDILDILDLEAGQARVKRSVELLPELREFIIRTNNARAAAAGVELEIDIKRSAQAWYHFDVMRLRQCVSAMTRQCVLQSRGGTVKVVIEATAAKRKKTRNIVVTVSDSSIGVEQAIAEQYFSPDEFVRNPLLMKSGASPLSLIVARMMARLMRGDVTVTSAPGEGVTFRCEIPAKFVRVAKDSNTAADITPYDRASRIMRDKVVLAVEDNTVNLKVLEAFLKRIGPKQLLTATNGAEALEALKANKCDVVLMDIQMPVMDGLTATKHIRASDAPWRNLPIVAITAGARGEEREACQRAGVTSFLAKPISADELYETLARVCSE